MNRFEKYLIDICAPTLAGIKAGSLFCLPTEDGKEDSRILLWDRALSQKGVRVTALKSSGNGRLMYVYRPAAVSAMLYTDENVIYLSKMGYETDAAAGDYIEALRGRVQRAPVFPHEIGLFLGYPLHDVTGFTENAGRNACCSGFWKVYGDRPSAERRFEQYRRCISEYQALYRRGMNVLQLTEPWTHCRTP